MICDSGSSSNDRLEVKLNGRRRGGGYEMEITFKSDCCYLNKMIVKRIYKERKRVKFFSERDSVSKEKKAFQKKKDWVSEWGSHLLLMLLAGVKLI